MFSQSTLRCLAIRFLSRTTEEWVVSSANNLGFEDKSSDESLIYINKKIEPRLDPWWTPARILASDEVRPLKKLFCLQFLRKLLSWKNNSSYFMLT